MPRAQRTPEQIESVKKKILETAVELMNRVGYRDFSMRGLARELKVSPPTLYTYFHDKDELYLCILIEGFKELYGLVEAECSRGGDPFGRLRGIARAYVDFGLHRAHFYNLMFTWHVPKYNDYLGTPVEEVARLELETALGVARLVTGVIRECAGEGYTITEQDARFLLVCVWSTLHGFIAGINNTLLTYMHEDPLSLVDDLVDHVHERFVQDIRARMTPRDRAAAR
ncbi:MAG TPA: TetR/AcrR family transcriptional regulator [Deltaproteobacteria bacterium]|nr:TetR/AcrR family transcriptional regulator [Deltaproteobacteria bacterium]HOM27905.1 TetR/AcrR family transcriptional regulator [Deltaproteobacteria bacterium]HPP79427.1 TetR/AcrR family transcriptional regulator [Deltaproteobacteria bacterium]